MNDVIKILFVCHGNICRSPMAEFVMRSMVEERGIAGRFLIASAATSTEELGNPVYPPAQRVMNRHGIDCSGKYARQIRQRDYDDFDHIVGMDKRNVTNMLRFWGSDPEQKISLLLTYAGENREVSDPWYSGDFESTWRDVNLGCAGLLDHLLKN